MTESPPSPAPDKPLDKTLFTVRYVIPAILMLVGLVCLFVVPSGTGVDAWALFTAAGKSILLINVLLATRLAASPMRGRPGRGSLAA